MGTEMRTVALWVAVRGGLIALLPYCLGSILLYTRVRIENDAAYILWVKERVIVKEKNRCHSIKSYIHITSHPPKPYTLTPNTTILRTPHPYDHLKPNHYAFAFSSPSVNLKLTLLTQCRSSVGVLYPSPLNTCPKCPPQLLHTISVLSIPNELSVNRFTAPGTESKYAGQPQPDLNLWLALYKGASQPAQV